MAGLHLAEGPRRLVGAGLGGCVVVVVTLQIYNGVSAQVKRGGVISASINCAGFLCSAHSAKNERGEKTSSEFIVFPSARVPERGPFSPLFSAA